MSQPYSKEESEWVQLESGQRLRTHSQDHCSGRNCSIHNPSPKAEAIGYRFWRSDRHMMERICPHGIGHPDPDEIDFLLTIWDSEEVGWHSIHGCDGCCRESKSGKNT